jgi:hypothetical protein
MGEGPCEKRSNLCRKFVGEEKVESSRQNLLNSGRRKRTFALVS